MKFFIHIWWCIVLNGIHIEANEQLISKAEVSLYKDSIMVSYEVYNDSDSDKYVMLSHWQSHILLKSFGHFLGTRSSEGLRGNSLLYNMLYFIPKDYDFSNIDSLFIDDPYLGAPTKLKYLKIKPYENKKFYLLIIGNEILTQNLDFKYCLYFDLLYTDEKSLKKFSKKAGLDFDKLIICDDLYKQKINSKVPIITYFNDASLVFEKEKKKKNILDLEEWFLKNKVNVKDFFKKTKLFKFNIKNS